MTWIETCYGYSANTKSLKPLINHGELTPKDNLTQGDVYHLVKTSLYTCPTLANTFCPTSTPDSPEDESGGSQGGKGIGPQ